MKVPAFDYTVLYKERLDLADLAADQSRWSILISAYNASERVQRVFSTVTADEKHWLVLPEYQYRKEQHPTNGKTFTASHLNEADFLRDYIAATSPTPLREGLCVDITGFMRPHLMLLTRLIFDAGISKFDVLYTDPNRYAQEERTEFTKGPVVAVRQVAGFEGRHVPDRARDDLLVIGTGYDHELIRRVAESKENAHKVQMFGLPSLQPDMYQENVLRAHRASEAIGQVAGRDSCFAPANDPFVTAAVLQERVELERRGGRLGNLYLSPLGTKPQALGFALYYLTEWAGGACSVIFPFAERYEQETTRGIARIWKYTIERLN